MKHNIVNQLYFNLKIHLKNEKKKVKLTYAVESKNYYK